MGILISEVFKLLSLIKDKNIRSICMIGKQDIDIDFGGNRFIEKSDLFGMDYDKDLYRKIKNKYPVDSYGFFKCWGVPEVRVLDISAFEGADLIFDLNSSELPAAYKEKFDLVIDGGTTEHIFNVANCMNNLAGMVKKGGYIYHMLPCAGWVDHGFYSFSPTFFLDYYGQNSFQIEDVSLRFESENGVGPVFYSQDCRLFLTYQELNQFIKKHMDGKRVQLRCIARKKDVVYGRIPIQGMYQKEYSFMDVDYDYLTEVIKKAGGVSLYGVGDVCNTIINELIKRDCGNMVHALFDSDISKAASTFRGYKICFPTKEKLKQSNVVLISSTRFEQDIYEFLLSQEMDEEKILKLSDMK